MSQPQRFGQYLLLERISAGGMAEIFKAMTQGIGGFEKLLAIKRIHPKYSADEKFIKMMVDEAKISVHLNHVNIAQIFDLGLIEGMYYIAMEYIDGRDLHRIMRRCQELGRRLPIEAAVFIAHELCGGLDYAHTKRDAENRPLGIIHRDVSPQNVLISFDGQVKLVDFGIAKHAIRSRETDAGIIKGKFSYMSPEQAWGDPVDHRTDIFSTGIVLFEMLTGTMLYNETDELKLLDRIRKADVELPSSRCPEIPRDLDVIVMKALAKRPEARYQTAHEFQTALARFLYTKTRGFSVPKMADLMRELFAAEIDASPSRLGRQTQSLPLMSRDEFPVRTAGSLLEGETHVGETQRGPDTKENVNLDDEPTRVWDRRRGRDGRGREASDYEPTPVGRDDGYQPTGLRRAAPAEGVVKLRTETGEYEVLDGEDLEEIPPSSISDVPSEPTVVDARSPFYEGAAAAEATPSPAPEPEGERPPWQESDEEFTDVFTPPPKGRAPTTPAPPESVPLPPLLSPEPAGQSPPARRVAVATRAPARRAALLWGGGAALALAAAVLGIWYGTREDERVTPQPASVPAAPEPARAPTIAVTPAPPVPAPPLVPDLPTAPTTSAAAPSPTPSAGAAPAPSATPSAGAAPAPSPTPSTSATPKTVIAPPAPEKRATARILVQTRPRGAILYIDGRRKGRTGRWYEVEAGRTVRLKVRRRGWRSATQTVEVSEGDQRFFFSLTPLPRRRRVAHAPAPADTATPSAPVAAASEPQPAAASEPTPVAAAPEPTPAAAPAEAPKVHTSPLPAHGFLSVNARPWGEVYVDGSKVAEQTPLLRFRLRPGVHRVRVFFVPLKRYSAERKVVIVSGEAKTLLFRE